MKIMLLFVSLIFTQLVNAQIDSAKIYFNKGDTAFEQKRFLLAEKNYVKGLRYDSTNNTIINNLASCYIEMRRYGNALMLYKKLYANNNNDNNALNQLAELSFMGHNWNEAVQYSKLCVEKNIGSKMHYKIAKSYFEQEDYALSSKSLGAASKEEPTNGEIPYLMANIWLQMQRADKAIEMFKIALQLDTTKYAWYYELGNTYHQIDSLNEAIPYFEKALEKGLSNDLQMQRTLGILYLSCKKYEKGIEIMEKVIAKKPMDKSLYEDMGYAFYENKKYDDAITWWDKILTIDQNDARTLYMIGIAYQKKGDDTKGNKLCDLAIEMDPKLMGLRKEMKMPQGMGL